MSFVRCLARAAMALHALAWRFSFQVFVLSTVCNFDQARRTAVARPRPRVSSFRNIGARDELSVRAVWHVLPIYPPAPRSCPMVPRPSSPCSNARPGPAR